MGTGELRIKKDQNGLAVQYGKYPKTQSVTGSATKFTQVDISGSLCVQISSDSTFYVAKDPTETAFPSAIPVTLHTAGIDFIWVKGAGTIYVLQNMSDKDTSTLYYDLSGTVTDAADDAPLEAVLTLSPTDFDGIDLITTASATGAYSFLSLLSKNYSLQTLLSGYLSSSTAINMGSGDVTQNLELTAE